MQLPFRTTHDAPAASRPILEGIADDLGLVPNLAAVAGNSSALLAGLDGMRRAAGANRAGPVLREVAGLVAGVAVDNHYGIAFHSTVLTGLGFSASDLAAIRAGGPPEDTTATAVQALANEIVVQRGKVSDETIARVRASSLGDEAILEVVLEVTFASLVGLIDNLVGHVELDDFLRPQAV